ncbi:MAG: chemotaxis protein CheD [Gammaproteobacteria bacterium]
MIYHLGSAIDLFIHPGEYQFADEHFRIRTILGSCVAVVLWHPRRRIGGMCHFMLPKRLRPSGAPLDGRYGEEALELLVRQAAKATTPLEDYVVKVFGGGNMLAPHHAAGKDVATRNAEAALALIAARGLRIKAHSLGGIGHRHVIFDVASGDVWVRHVSGNGSHYRSVRSA